MKLNLRSACVAVATITMFNIPMLVQSAQAAPPPVCMQWGVNKCQRYDRTTPEWGECFNYYTTVGCPWWDGDIPPGQGGLAIKTEDN